MCIAVPRKIQDGEFLLFLGVSRNSGFGKALLISEENSAVTLTRSHMANGYFVSLNDILGVSRYSGFGK